MANYRKIIEGWKEGVVSWRIRDTLYISIPFTWLVGKALEIIRYSDVKHILVGGPGAILKKECFEGIALVKDSIAPLEPIIFHNPLATFTTRGCVNRCKFCAVPRIEGDFKEIHDFSPRPLICDNNFLASSRKHFDRVVDRLKGLPYVDFNQGLEAKRFIPYISNRLRELKEVKIRFAFDKLREESAVVDAFKLALKDGFRHLSCYLLVGFDDTPAEALYRVEVLQKLSKKIEIYPMRYQPLDADKRNEFVNKEKGWTDYELKRFCVYWRGHGIFLKKSSFDDFEPRHEILRGFFVDTYKNQRKGLYSD